MDHTGRGCMCLSASLVLSTSASKFRDFLYSVRLRHVNYNLFVLSERLNFFSGSRFLFLGLFEPQTVLNMFLFLDASTHLYKRVCPSVGPWSVRPSRVFFKSRKSRGNDIESLENKI